MNAVVRFVEAMNRSDIEAVAATYHPDFEMIVPQHPARGFRGRDQELRNMRHLMAQYPEGRIEILRMVETASDVWVETRFRTNTLEMAAVVIYEIDSETDTIRRGHFYSDAVDQGGPKIDDWLEGLGSGLSS